MTDKELGSLANQIRYCYAANRRTDNPVYLSISSLEGKVRELLDKVNGFPEQWEGRAFRCSDKSLVEMHPDKDKLVYLTSDSEHTLEHLDDSKIYVIGGIVDRNRLKRAAISRAESLGVANARLPIAEYLNLVTTKVLTTNHVFEILVKYRQLGNKWKEAMLEVLPNRKEAQAKDDNGSEHKTSSPEPKVSDST
jgi:tRNA (guanine9-N1)-methyltransferase